MASEAPRESFVEEKSIHPGLKGGESGEALASGMTFNPRGPGGDPK